jgi:hypothetical protein
MTSWGCKLTVVSGRVSLNKLGVEVLLGRRPVLFEGGDPLTTLVYNDDGGDFGTM